MKIAIRVPVFARKGIEGIKVRRGHGLRAGGTLTVMEGEKGHNGAKRSSITISFWACSTVQATFGSSCICQIPGSAIVAGIGRVKYNRKPTFRFTGGSWTVLDWTEFKPVTNCKRIIEQARCVHRYWKQSKEYYAPYSGASIHWVQKVSTVGG